MGSGNSIYPRDYEPLGANSRFPRFPGASQDSSDSSLFLNSQSYIEKPRTSNDRNNEEMRQNSPSAPSVTTLRQPHDTLLNYASQMTGWQSDYATSAPLVHQGAMELTRTVSHLAAANQQLATAHSALLGQLEGLYMELNKMREANAALQSSGIKKSVNEELRHRIEVVEDIVTTLSPKEMPEDCWRSVRKKENQGDNGEYVRREYQKAVERIKVLESELKASDNRSKDGGANADCRGNEKLLREIEKLKRHQLKLQEVNKKLRQELDEVRRDYEISLKNWKKIESPFNERQNALSELTNENEIRNSGEFPLDKDTAKIGITNRDADLSNGQFKIETQNNLAEEESFRLRMRLSQEVEGRKKLSDALEESLKEIQRLKGIIDDGKRVEDRRENSTDTGTSTDDVVERPDLDEFKQDLCMKREARQRAIAAVSSEIDRLRKELDAEKEAHLETSRVLDLLRVNSENALKKSETFSVGTMTTINLNDDSKTTNEFHEQNPIQRDAQRLTDVLKVSDELRSCIRLQIEKIDDLRYHLECEPDNNEQRIELLKEIARTNRETFELREKEINRLKNILSQIVARLGDDKFKIEITEDLRNEHDRQVEDVRRLKNIYDGRLRILVDLKDSACKELSNIHRKFKGSMKEKESLEEELKKSAEKIDNQDTEISNLESQLGLTKADCRDLQNQMSLINSLFSQMLLSASSADMDLDRLTQLLQENHDLISDMAREEGTEAAALPKLLLDLVEQVEGREKTKSIEGNSDKKDDDTQEESIANNLPKVWKVLTELLSCHAASSTTASTSSNLLSGDPNSCYKSVDTPTGPRLVISVSKTYIRLKELILEKKHLEKEMGRMKQLNSHLESKLGEQEKRLSTVSVELSKTWNIVGRMQAQHQQLHTHEKILRYELQQKRKMLQELKQELEYCREKWESARQKNTNTEIEWKNLRREFAARKALSHDSFNTSAESGFSDDRCDDSDEEEAPPEERSRAGLRRRTRKESPRAPTPDTESEQPTDTELSESKTESTSTPEQRTPTPETSEDALSTESSRDQHKEPMNPLDQALANVIHNLIQSDDNQNSNRETRGSPISKNEELKTPGNDEESIAIKNTSHEHPQDVNQQLLPEDTKRTHEEHNESSNSISVFSIGPFPSGKAVQFSDPLVIGPSTYVIGSLFGSRESQRPETSSEADEITIVADNSDEAASIVQEDKENSSKDERKIDSVEIPSTSRVIRTSEEVLAARDARLKRLEEQAEWLMKKMNATSRRGSALSTRLEELHEVYGEPPIPPPMPDVLPIVRLPTDPDLTLETESPKESMNSSAVDP